MVQMSCNMFKIKAVRNKEGHLSIQPKKNVHLKTALEVLKYTECCEQGLNVHLVKARNSSFTNKMVNASCKAGQGFSAFYFIHRYNYLRNFTWYQYLQYIFLITTTPENGRQSFKVEVQILQTSSNLFFLQGVHHCGVIK